MNKLGIALCLLTLMVGAFAGCSATPATPEGKADLDEQVNDVITTFKAKGPELKFFFDKSYGYAVLPDVGAGAIGIGGAYGRGEVFENGQLVGYCNMSQGTIGVQLGGQSYSEIIFFQSKAALDLFKQSQTAFDAAASAVAADAGASTTADYRKGFAVFTQGAGRVDVPGRNRRPAFCV